MPFKTKLQMAAIRRWKKLKPAKQKDSKNGPRRGLRYLVPLPPAATQDPTLPESTVVHNLAEPLLEILKEEPQPDLFGDEPPLDIPTTSTTLEPLIEVMLEIKPETTNPTGSDPISEVPLFCALCLRPCTSAQVVEFSTEPSWNCLDVASCRDKLALVLGLELDLEQSAICRSCWTMVETLADFREGCLKAATWRARFSFGLDEVGDDWLSKEQVEAMEWTRKTVQEHVERIEMAEVEARNRQDSGAKESPEEKPMLEDEQDWADDTSFPDSPEESPKNNSPAETPKIVDKLEIAAFSCEKCQRKFETKVGMRIHLDRCKKTSEMESFATQLHTCSVCSANFTKSSDLREHRNKHLGIKPYECRKENCNKRFHVYHARIIHERKCNGNNSSISSIDQESPEASSNVASNGPEIYSCGKCPRRFDTKGGLATHSQKCQRSGDGRQLRSCPICSMEFLYSKHLEAHINKHNGIKPYQCKNCDRHFYGKSALNHHVEICGKDKPVCPHCGLQLSTRGTLKVHLKTHAEEAAAECETCGKKFKSKKNLNKHQAVHSGERNYPCNECGKALKSANALRVHQRIHTQEKPYSCAICGQGFAYKCLVGPHMKKCRAEQD